jgi:hypothetical protein
MFKLLFWTSLVTIVMWQCFPVLNIYKNNSIAQDAFEQVSRKMEGASAQAIRRRLSDTLLVMRLPRKALPAAFYEHLEIQTEHGRVKISSWYHKTIWPLGPVQQLDEEGGYDAEELTGLDALRDRLRMDFDFYPSASSFGEGDD